MGRHFKPSRVTIKLLQKSLNRLLAEVRTLGPVDMKASERLLQRCPDWLQTLMGMIKESFGMGLFIVDHHKKAF